jgi:diguanylate cyclase (GGDEF)-like protein
MRGRGATGVPVRDERSIQVPSNLEPVLTLLLVAVLANLVVMGIVLIPPLIGRRSPLPLGRPVDASDRVAAEYAVLGEAPVPYEAGSVPAGTYDRVVRIVSWVFILATFMIVAVTGLWPKTQLAIFALLAFAGMFVLVVHDLLPPRSLGTAKFIVEGSVAITFATLLVLLTGAENSPFFFTFPLIVGGAALVVAPRVTFALAAIASLGYIFATALPEGPVQPVTVAKVGINLTALVLLAYVATVIAREQRQARDAAVRLSTIDPLTGLFNRTFFFAAVDREIARSLRSNRGFCLLMMDLDELKTINDRYGHYFGDQVLRGVGEVIRSGVRRIDTSARYGGDEFVVLLPETDPTGAWVLAEKVRIGVTELNVSVAGTEIAASISVGVVGYPDDGATSDQLMISADQAMYASKRGGKNRVTSLPVAVGGSGVESV